MDSVEERGRNRRKEDSGCLLVMELVNLVRRQVSGKGRMPDDRKRKAEGLQVGKLKSRVNKGSKEAVSTRKLESDQ